jgi:hypothetical protein
MSKNLEVGDQAGFIVLTKTHAKWADDWDGELHPDLAHGADAVRAARAAHCEAVLVGCYVIAEHAIRDTTAGGGR